MDINVLPRPKRTKGERRRRLRQGLIPAAVYGRGLEPRLIEVPARSVANVLLSETGLNTVLTLAVKGEKATHTVLIDNLERDPITRNFLNVGFHQVNQGDKVHAQIPIVLEGMPTDVALNGALLEQTLEHLDVTAEPGDLPAHLSVDVSGLKIGEVIRVMDLPHNPKVIFTTPEEVAIVAVHVSTTVRQVEAAEATAPVSEEVLTGQDAVTELRADKDPASDSITGTQAQP
jgi:large subunit ribosomal protein L25